jgi:hypothetical protein
MSAQRELVQDSGFNLVATRNALKSGIATFLVTLVESLIPLGCCQGLVAFFSHPRDLTFRINLVVTLSCLIQPAPGAKAQEHALLPLAVAHRTALRQGPRRRRLNQ